MARRATRREPATPPAEPKPVGKVTEKQRRIIAQYHAEAAAAQQAFRYAEIKYNEALSLVLEPLGFDPTTHGILLQTGEIFSAQK